MAVTTILLSVAGVLLAVLGAVVKITWGAARELRGLRAAISDLREEIAKNRGKDREWVRDHVNAKIREHAADCPAREPTGVRAHPSGRFPVTRGF